MPDQHHGNAQLLLEPLDRLHDLALHDDIERARGLVRDDHLRPHRDGDGDTHALLHAPTQLVREHVGHLGTQVHRLEHLLDAIVQFGVGQPAVVILNAVDDLLADAGHRVERVHGALRNQADLVQAHAAHALLRDRH